MKHCSGHKEHLRGPLVMHCNPVHHESIRAEKGITLETFEALVVYSDDRRFGHSAERGEPAPRSPEAAGHSAMQSTVRRRVIRGPTLFFPDASEWIHAFSWHGARPTASASTPGRHAIGEDAEKGGHVGDKQPHALKFTKLNLTPTQLYFDVKDARTTDDAQITIGLMVFYHIVGARARERGAPRRARADSARRARGARGRPTRAECATRADVELMLDTTQDPIGDFVNALAADIMSFAADKAYEHVLSRTASMCELATFPILCGRAKSIGFTIDKVVFRGLRTSSHLQDMHNKAVSNATRLRLEALEAEQRERQLDLGTRHKAERERAQLAADSHAAAELRERADKEHAQRLRHWREQAQAEHERAQLQRDTELAYFSQLADRGVDLTTYLVAREASRPSQHIRIDGAAAELAQVHIALPHTEGKADGAKPTRAFGLFG